MINLIFPVTGMIATSLLTEASLEFIKKTIPNQFSESGKIVTTMVIAVGVAFTLDISIVEGTAAQHSVGCILAGIISSRGSNYIHDLAKILKTIPYFKVKE